MIAGGGEDRGGGKGEGGGNALLPQFTRLGMILEERGGKGTALGVCEVGSDSRRRTRERAKHCY